jgi:hypothetical protein
VVFGFLDGICDVEIKQIGVAGGDAKSVAENREG